MASVSASLTNQPFIRVDDDCYRNDDNHHVIFCGNVVKALYKGAIVYVITCPVTLSRLALP